jgi:hypothetical protein
MKASDLDSTPIIHKLRRGKLLAGEHIVDGGSSLACPSVGHAGFDHHLRIDQKSPSQLKSELEDFSSSSDESHHRPTQRIEAL